MTKLTEEQKRKYLESGGTKCPFCNSTDITAEPIEADGSGGYSDVKCDECNQEWRDIWSLTDVEDTE